MLVINVSVEKGHNPVRSTAHFVPTPGIIEIH